MWEMMVRAMKNRGSKIINITTQDRIYRIFCPQHIIQIHMQANSKLKL